MLEQKNIFDEVQKLPDPERRDAIFSVCGRYRYILSRHWDDSKPKIIMIGLNPSTANADVDDPTIKNVRRICANNGFGGFFMMNLFALITPHPEVLSDSDDPVGENDLYLASMRDATEHVCFCWGNFGYEFIKQRIEIVEQMFPKAVCVGINKNGSPKHPLYIPQEINFINFK